VGEGERKLFQKDIYLSPHTVLSLSGHITASILEVSELLFTARIQIFEEKKRE